jgi:hypothetical protein
VRQYPLLVAKSPIIVADDSSVEDLVLAGLSSRERWQFIAKRHPLEFLSVLIAIFCVAYFLVKYLWVLFPIIGELIVDHAYAQDRPGVEISLGALGISVQSFAVVFLALVLLWFMGIFSWSTKESKIKLARDNLKSLVGFFIGLATGSGLSR